MTMSRWRLESDVAQRSAGHGAVQLAEQRFHDYDTDCPSIVARNYLKVYIATSEE